jgi:hypothetical protein
MNDLLDENPLREGPPRYLNILTCIETLFGGFNIQFGSIFFAIGGYLLMEPEGPFVAMFDYENDLGWQRGYSFSFFSRKLLGSLPLSLLVIFGFRWLLFGFKENIKELILLRIGIFTSGKVVSCNETILEINNRQVYAYEFEFHINGERYITRCRAYIDDKIEEIGKILYYKKNPKFSFVYGGLLESPEIEQFGKIKQSNLQVLILLVLPLISIYIVVDAYRLWY